MLNGKKYKKITLALALTASLIANFTGCGANAGNENAKESLTDVSSDVSLDGPSDGPSEDSAPVTEVYNTIYLTDEAYAKADAWASCDDSRVAAVMKKAERGEKITIACIGGSITEGTIARGDRDGEIDESLCYAERFFAWWSETFQGTEIEFVNAGIGGTDSYLGVHRLKRDVLSKNPDLVLIEYAVNDGDNISYKKSYENLLRNVLDYETHPAAMLLFMEQTSGVTAQGSEALVGFNYSVPMLSYANAIDLLMENGKYTAEDLSGDGVHPSALGHAICGEILWKYLNSVYENLDGYGEPDITLPASTTKTAYENADITDSLSTEPVEMGSFTEYSDNSYFPNGWSCDGGEEGITFKLTFKNLGILYISQKTGDPGKFDILIDGETVRTLDADYSSGWGNAITGTEVYTSDEEAEHTVTIIRNTESEGREFKLLGLLTS